MKSIEIYKSIDGETQIDVKFEKDTVWLTLNQISELFGRDKSVVSRHMRNIFLEGELDEASTVAKNATVQNESGRKVKRNIDYYDIDRNTIGKIRQQAFLNYKERWQIEPCFRVYKFSTPQFHNQIIT